MSENKAEYYGIPSFPEPANIHKGERIVPAEENTGLLRNVVTGMARRKMFLATLALPCVPGSVAKGADSVSFENALDHFFSLPDFISELFTIEFDGVSTSGALVMRISANETDFYRRFMAAARARDVDGMFIEYARHKNSSDVV